MWVVQLLHAGRVNLIGEHIDYEGYSVLPMAIRQDTIVAIRKHDSSEPQKLLRIANVNSDKYSLCTYPADPLQVYMCFWFVVSDLVESTRLVKDPAWFLLFLVWLNYSLGVIIGEREYGI